ncbi:MAG: ABC transporter permease, partial [Planctomycetes bacterium]|nr:ABC transporter permease [Planctomycetota bacterium]
MNSTAQSPQRLKSNLESQSRWNLLGNVLGPFLALGVVYLFFGITDSMQTDGGTFLTPRNNHALAVSTATVAVAALGMTLVIISGGIDLSAGTALALSATVLAWCLKENVSPLLAIVAAVGTGCLTGFLNGVLISALRVVPFIVTLGTMTLYLGVAKIIASETTVRPDRTTQIPDWLGSFLSLREKALVPGDGIVPWSEQAKQRDWSESASWFQRTLV